MSTRTCTKCQQSYPLEVASCPQDGTPLKEGKKMESPSLEKPTDLEGILQNKRTNLRPLPTRFIGRAEALEALFGLLGARRLVTLLGAPGVGKTRLARELGLQRVDAFSGGVWMCELTEAKDLDGLCACVVRALRLSLPEELGPKEVLARLSEEIDARGEALLVLDNVEHLLGATSEALSAWMSAAPRARFLTTSRARLGLSYEALFDLAPLSLPTSERELEGSEAAQLFFDRARMVRRGYSPSPEEAPALLELLRQLDGLPLALELAATRLRVLSPAQMTKHLDRRFQLLAGSGTQRTLRGALDWSWELLSPNEQAALAQCSVFRGGFALEAAEAVLQMGPDPTAPFTLDVLQALCDKSLLLCEAPQAAPQELRFGLYVSVREYALERLGAGREAAYLRHAEHFLHLGAALLQRLQSPERSAARRQIELERENLLAVHERAVSGLLGANEVHRGLEVALLLRRAFLGRESHHRILSWLDDALAAAPEAPPTLRATALCYRGRTLRFFGKSEEGLSDVERARALAEAAGDRALAAVALFDRSTLLMFLHRYDEAEEHFRRALALEQELGNRPRQALCYGQLSVLEMNRERFSVSREYMLRALPLFRETGELDHEISIFSNLILLALERGDLEEAEHWLEKLGLAREIGSREQEMVYLFGEGLLLHERGALERAEESYEQALSLCRVLRNDRFGAWMLVHLGICLHEQGRIDAALASYDRALPLQRALKYQEFEGLLLGYKGAALAQEGRIEEATAASHSAKELLSDQRPSFLAAVEILAKVLDAGPARKPYASAHPSLETRRAQRILTRSLARTQAYATPQSKEQAPPDPPLAAPSAQALQIGESGRWFQPPGGERISLLQRRPIRLLLLRLVKHRVQAPGAALPVGALFESGWPKERAHPEAARSRVYAALSQLRNLGLREILVRRDDGYLLDPSVPIQSEG